MVSPLSNRRCWELARARRISVAVRSKPSVCRLELVVVVAQDVRMDVGGFQYRYVRAQTVGSFGAWAVACGCGWLAQPASTTAENRAVRRQERWYMGFRGRAFRSMNLADMVTVRRLRRLFLTIKRL
jgi:hypothetical protein